MSMKRDVKFIFMFHASRFTFLDYSPLTNFQPSPVVVLMTVPLRNVDVKRWRGWLVCNFV